MLARRFDRRDRHRGSLRDRRASWARRNGVRAPRARPAHVGSGRGEDAPRLDGRSGRPFSPRGRGARAAPPSGDRRVRGARGGARRARVPRDELGGRRDARGSRAPRGAPGAGRRGGARCQHRRCALRGARGGHRAPRREAVEPAARGRRLRPPRPRRLRDRARRASCLGDDARGDAHRHAGLHLAGAGARLPPRGRARGSVLARLRALLGARRLGAVPRRQSRRYTRQDHLPRDAAHPHRAARRPRRARRRAGEGHVQGPRGPLHQRERDGARAPQGPRAHRRERVGLGAVDAPPRHAGDDAGHLGARASPVRDGARRLGDAGQG